ncbi:MAG TPA: hypothetical protein VGF61_02045 [Candidatus Acidoferrum sp.]|jgi:hypothetical protein
MKSLLSMLSVALLSLSTIAFAQSDAQKLPSDSQKAFDKLKTLAGSWEGHVTTTPVQPEMGDGARVDISLRVTSRGNAMVHEMKAAGTADDPTRYDHPVTMFYLDSDRLLMTHYCDAGNRPRMEGKISPGGKTVEFDFLDLSGSTQYGHMHHVVFTFIDASHHLEEWTYMTPGDKPVRARLDLQRTK